MKPYLSFIIPAFNEESRLGGTLQTVIDYFSAKPYESEIVVVDDGSSDGTVEMASKDFEDVKIIELGKNLGKGAAVREGMLKSTGRIRIFSDADLSTPVYETEKIIKCFENGHDVCFGSRALDYSLIREHQPFYREFMGKTFNKIVQFMVLPGIKDTQCGFKGFTEEAAMKIFNEAKIDGFGFDVEVLYLAKKMGYKMREIPVEWYNDERSKVSPVRDSLQSLSDIFRVKKLHG